MRAFLSGKLSSFPSGQRWRCRTGMLWMCGISVATEWMPWSQIPQELLQQLGLTPFFQIHFHQIRASPGGLWGKLKPPQLTQCFVNQTAQQHLGAFTCSGCRRAGKLPESLITYAGIFLIFRISLFHKECVCRDLGVNLFC